jgi:hypothetical protein
MDDSKLKFLYMAKITQKIIRLFPDDTNPMCISFDYYEGQNIIINQIFYVKLVMFDKQDIDITEQVLSNAIIRTKLQYALIHALQEEKEVQHA